MRTLITNGIKITVESKYEKNASNPTLTRYIHSYTITIENLSNKTVKLLRRYWEIIDGDGSKREVSGVGVIGKQPTLLPGESHRYSSWSPVSFPNGKMSGHYIMKDLDGGKEFTVNVPSFILTADFKNN